MPWRFARSDDDMAMGCHTYGLVYKNTYAWFMYIRITTQSKVHLSGVSYTHEIRESWVLTHCAHMAEILLQFRSVLQNWTQANCIACRRQQITSRLLERETSGRLQAGRQRLDVDPDPGFELLEASMFQTDL